MEAASRLHNPPMPGRGAQAGAHHPNAGESWVQPAACKSNEIFYKSMQSTSFFILNTTWEPFACASPAQRQIFVQFKSHSRRRRFFLCEFESIWWIRFEAHQQFAPFFLTLYHRPCAFSDSLLPFKYMHIDRTAAEMSVVLSICLPCNSCKHGRICTYNSSRKTSYSDSHNYWPCSAMVFFICARVNNCGNLSTERYLALERAERLYAPQASVCVCVYAYVCMWLHVIIIHVCR